MLTGNDLIVFSIIYGFSQDGESEFYGSTSYLARWCGSTRQGISKNLNNLIKLGYIEKVETKRTGKPNHYRICDKVFDIQGHVNIVDIVPCKQSLQPDVNKVDTQCKVSLHNNLEDTKELKIDNNISLYNQSIYLESYVKRQINYDKFDDGRIDEIVVIMSEVLNTTQKKFKIGREFKDAEHVKYIFLKINEFHIEYVFESLNKNTTEIKNIKSYLITCLYNSVFTIESYYDAKMRHDLKGE